MDEKRCWNCLYFDGILGDGTQFCDEREEYVNEYGFCFRYVKQENNKE